MNLQRLGEAIQLDVRAGPDGAACSYTINADGYIEACRPDARVAESELVVTPGMVDIQVNGFAGVDFNAAGLTAAKLDAALSAMLATGVTRCLPTLITASAEDLVSLVEALDAAVSESRLGPFMVPGYHIEGPFLSPEPGYVGAHPPQHTQKASPELVRKLQQAASRPILMMTVAPEVDGVLDLIPMLKDSGIACAIGHSAANRDQIDAAIAAGAIMSTHLGNGQPHLLNKNESSMLVQLSRDALMASFIADGIHIPSDILKCWLRAKTVSRSLLTTDASAGAGAPGRGGTFTIGPQTIERAADGSVRIPGSNYLAGSAETLDQMVRNVMDWYGFELDDVMTLTRTNPLRAIGLDAEMPGIGETAGFVVWHRAGKQMHVKQAYAGPWMVRRQEGF